jgi:hypothetical protein
MPFLPLTKYDNLVLWQEWLELSHEMQIAMIPHRQADFLECLAPLSWHVSITPNDQSDMTDCGKFGWDIRRIDLSTWERL